MWSIKTAIDNDTYLCGLLYEEGGVMARVSFRGIEYVWANELRNATSPEKKILVRSLEQIWNAVLQEDIGNGIYGC